MWIDASEGKPDAGVKVLVYAVFHVGKPEQHVCHYTEGHFGWRKDESNGIAEKCITHWMPLPEPPNNTGE